MLPTQVSHLWTAAFGGQLSQLLTVFFSLFEHSSTAFVCRAFRLVCRVFVVSARVTPTILLALKWSALSECALQVSPCANGQRTPRGQHCVFSKFSHSLAATGTKANQNNGFSQVKNQSRKSLLYRTPWRCVVFRCSVAVPCAHKQHTLVVHCGHSRLRARAWRTDEALVSSTHAASCGNQSVCAQCVPQAMAGFSATSCSETSLHVACVSQADSFSSTSNRTYRPSMVSREKWMMTRLYKVVTKLGKRSGEVK